MLGNELANNPTRKLLVAMANDLVNRHYEVAKKIQAEGFSSQIDEDLQPCSIIDTPFGKGTGCEFKNKDTKYNKLGYISFIIKNNKGLIESNRRLGVLFKEKEVIEDFYTLMPLGMPSYANNKEQFDFLTNPQNSVTMVRNSTETYKALENYLEERLGVIATKQKDLKEIMVISIAMTPTGYALLDPSNELYSIPPAIVILYENPEGPYCSAFFTGTVFEHRTGCGVQDYENGLTGLAITF